MNYRESVNYIHSLLKFGIRPGLSRMDALLSLSGEPHKKMKFVHVAGTNGKGSVSTAISNVLIDAGYKVGLYTSPYVTEFLERVQYMGSPVDKELFAECVSRLVPLITEMNSGGAEVTEFEALTAAAFLCFEKLGCDVVVLEVGLGGRLDATNVIDTPLVNCITSLSLDHTAILGDTVGKIAFEKCGTVKEGSSVVSAYGQPEEALEVIRKTCAEKHASLTVPEKANAVILSNSVFGLDFVFENEEYHVPMAGAHQLINMTVVIKACELLSEKGFAVSRSNIRNGIAKTALPARVEVISEKPLVILDGGHNEAGAAAFFDALSTVLPCKGRLTVVAGMMADKDVEVSLEKLMKTCDRFFAVTPENPRSMKADELEAIAGKYCCETYCAKSVSGAIADSAADMTENDVLCVVGSLYLAGEARNELLKIFKK